MAAILATGCVMTDQNVTASLWVSSAIDNDGVLIVQAAGMEMARVLSVPSRVAPAYVGTMPVDSSQPIEASRAHVYDARCRSLGEVTFHGGSWLLTLESDGPDIREWIDDDPVPPRLPTSPTSCGHFGTRDAFSISVYNATNRELLVRLAFPRETLLLEPGIGDATVLYIGREAVPGRFEVLDPATCKVLTAGPLLDVSMYVSIEAPFDRESLELITGAVAPASEPEAINAQAATTCSQP